MRTLKFTAVFLIAFLLGNLTVVAQNKDDEYMIKEVKAQEDMISITGLYTGMEDGMFVFSFIDEDNVNDSMIFDNISKSARKMFDLSSEKFIGKKFKIEFITENIADNDDDMLDSIKTIISLKQL